MAAPTAKATTPRKLKAGADLSNHNALAEQIVNTPRQSPKKKDARKTPKPDAREGDADSESKTSTVKRNLFQSDSMKSNAVAGTQKQNKNSTSAVPAKKKSQKSKARQPEPNTAQTDIRDHFKPARSSSRKLELELKKAEEDRVIQQIRDELEPGLTVVDVAGKGKGVVADRNLMRSEYVCEYSGELVSLAEARRREEAYAKAERESAGQPMCYMYFFRCEGRGWCPPRLCLTHSVDATVAGRIGRLINHSRTQPNLCTKLFVVDGRPRLGLVALRDIRAGEELCYDYGERSKAAVASHPWLRT